MSRPNTSISVFEDVVEVTMGRATVSAPVGDLSALVEVLGAVRTIVQARPATTGRKSAAPTSRSTRAPAQKTSTAKSAKSTAPKRRSRKRVGVALKGWMEANPGWHSEQKLLDVVIDNKMSDARPKYALKIALGRARGTVFEEGTAGFWKLVADTSAGAPPKPKPKARRGAKKKRGGGRKGTAKRARRSGRDHEWSKISDDEVERARKNLLGLSRP